MRSIRIFKSVSVLAIAALLCACTPLISVKPGINATEPICADVVLSLPEQVIEQSRAKTTSQATAAWGKPGSAVTFTCGVEEPTVSEDCQSVTANVFGEQKTFDWITYPVDGGFTFVSYGRSPAMMLQVPASLVGDQPTAALIDVAMGVSKTEATKFCQ